MKRILFKFLISDDGPTAVEYAVMLAMIVGACLLSISLMSQNTAASFDNSAHEISTALGS